MNKMKISENARSVGEMLQDLVIESTGVGRVELLNDVQKLRLARERIRFLEDRLSDAHKREAQSAREVFALREEVHILTRRADLYEDTHDRLRNDVEKFADNLDSSLNRSAVA